MKLTKIRLTKDASNRLRFLAGKTGLTPNLLCRLGFCLSLAEPRTPNPDDFPEEDREFNRYTLLGEYDSLFIALLKQRCSEDGLPIDLLPEVFRAHLNRGIMLLQNRVKGLSDLAELVASAQKTSHRSL
ncbi:MAG: DNA sulfur modification protein DndE [Acidobacteria bacterium]|nr:MAG: DNA sulfur modification protein DndE [Acidobacteriota bacterium]